MKFNNILILFILVFTASLSAHAEVESKTNYNAYIYPQISHPAANSDWFEWWYTKVIDPKTNRAFFLVYGIVNPWDTKGSREASRANVSFGDFSKKYMYERKLPVTDFHASSDVYSVQMGGTGITPAFATAGNDSVKGEMIDDHGVNLKWDLHFENSWSFNAMGWAMQIPNFTNIGWYPAQASTLISGSISQGDDVVTFERAPGYQDRNWGSGFPKWWTWIVAHQFEGEPLNGDTTLVSGGGAPDILGRLSPYEGVSAALRYRGKVYNFRPSDGCFPKTDVTLGKWEITAKNLNGVSISISAKASPESFMDLPFQSPAGPVFHDLETLNGDVTVKLKVPGKKMIQLISHQAGIEYGSF